MKVAVVGGGPAGMMAAIAASDALREAGITSDITLIERQAKVGRKLYISGKGRCNVTNVAEGADFLANVVSNPKFLSSAIRNFSPTDTVDFFEKSGVPLKLERGGRFFPVSDKASDIIDALFAALKKRKIKVLFGSAARRLITENGAVTALELESSTGVGETLSADRFVIATGGLSYTGLVKEAFYAEEMLKAAGIPFVEQKPALAPIIIKGAYAAEGAFIPKSELPFPEGLSLENVTIRAEGCSASEFGELLFTSEGVSGPAVLSLSSRINRTFKDTFALYIDLKPALTKEKLDARLIRVFAENPNKAFKTAAAELLPRSLIDYAVRLSGIAPLTPVNSVTKEERARFLSVLKEMKFLAAGIQGINAAIVTAGGADVSAIDPKTMKSKILKNLSFAGEIIDVDALTGGFNIQIALSTGFAAGKNII